jgi:hypothetical protein
MRKWRITIPETEIELEAEDEGQALIEADSSFDFIDSARVEEIEPDEEDEVLQ